MTFDEFSALFRGGLGTEITVDEELYRYVTSDDFLDPPAAESALREDASPC
jgi:hypothetical protein